MPCENRGPTRQRRIHLTDAEWAEIGQAAEARAVSRSRHVADAVLGAPLSSDPTTAELIDGIRLAPDGIADRLAPVAERAAPVDAVRLCTRVERIEGRLITAVDGATASRSGQGR